MANQGKKWVLFSGAAAAVGLAAFYFLEGERGKNRRAAFSRKAARLGANLVRSATTYASDVQHRLKGIAREAWDWPARPARRSRSGGTHSLSDGAQNKAHRWGYPDAGQPHDPLAFPTLM